MTRFNRYLLAMPLAVALTLTWTLPSQAVVTPPSPIAIVVEQVNVTMPDNVSVPMWKMRLASDPPGTPLPVISAVAGDTLTIHLTNTLSAEPVSLVINGQRPTSMTPTWTDGSTGPRVDLSQRVRSFTHEAAPYNIDAATAGTATYEWTNLKAGTYLLTSGTHPAVQVPMGLYAALKVDAAAGQAYGPSTAYAGEAVLLFSEVDPDLNHAVANGTYGTEVFTTALAMKSAPRYFLINGAPYSSAAGVLPVAGPGQKTVLRFLNAGNHSRVPVIQNEYLTLIADDGNPLARPSQSYSLDLAAGKTLDAMIQPTTGGVLAIHERTGGLAGGGMLAYLG
ncbi:MAG: hypothetical protein IH614_16745, partial [Desulfuromonadales bacterium]|nr:hypothetical protein [Desulfuromonadales bacterium]